MLYVGRSHNNVSLSIARKLLTNVISADWFFQMLWGPSIGTGAVGFFSTTSRAFVSSLLGDFNNKDLPLSNKSLQLLLIYFIYTW